MRPHVLLATALSFSILACDTETTEPEVIPTEAVLANITLIEDARPEDIVAIPDTFEDSECTTYKFGTRTNGSFSTNCSSPTPEPKIPILIPDLEDMLAERLGAQAAASCAADGALWSDGSLPAGGGPMAMLDGGGPIDAFVDPQTGEPVPIIGDGPLGGGGKVPILPVAPPLCQTVCASFGKVWDFAAPDYGTCAFNKQIVVGAPKVVTNNVCAPGQTQWNVGGAVQTDCGCRCI